jgi:hypothetical protein
VSQLIIHHAANARSHSIPCFIRATLSYNHYKNIQHNEHKRETDSFKAIGIQDAAEAIRGRTLVGGPSFFSSNRSSFDFSDSNMAKIYLGGWPPPRLYVGYRPK